MVTSLYLLVVVMMGVGAYKEKMKIDVADVHFEGKSFPAATVNGSLLGPTIHVAVGERLSLSVELSSAIRDLSIHFHGFEMKGQQAYDGVVGITQCAIRPGMNFTYDFAVNEKAGTYWYHTHSGGGAGIWHNFIHGPLIVHSQSVPTKALKSPLAYKKERIIFLSDVFKSPPKIGYKTAAGGLNAMASRGSMGDVVGTHPWWGALLNGAESESPGTVIRVKINKSYRFRLINGAHLFAFNFSIPGIKLKVIATDSSALPCADPVIVDSIFIWPAERYDFEINFPSEMNNSTLSMQATTLESSEQGYDHHVYGRIKVGMSAPDAVSLPRHKLPKHPVVLNCYSLRLPVICIPLSQLAQDSRWCKHNKSLITPSFAITTADIIDNVEISSFNRSSSVKMINVHFLDFKFNPPPQYSRMVRLDNGPYIQHVNPYYPLIGPSVVEDNLHPSTVLLDLELGTTAILVLRTSNNMHHPMHIHGHAFEVLDQYSVDTSSDNHCSIFGCRLTDRYTATKLDVFKRMPYTGLLKDTVLLPAGGAVVLRFEVNNPGVWFSHCHIMLHKEDGMAFIIREGGEAAARSAQIPPDSPVCLPSDSQSMYPSCQCWEDTDQLRDYRLQRSWICSRDWLCHHDEKYDIGVLSSSFHRGIACHGINSDTDVILLTFFIACVVLGLLLYWWNDKLCNGTVKRFWINKLINQHTQCPRQNDRNVSRVTNRTHDNDEKATTELSSQEDLVPPVDTVQVEFLREWKATCDEIVNPMRCMEVVGLALLTGSVFYQVGEDTTYRGLRESISLLFYSVTLWTFTRMYPSIPAHYLWQKRVTVRLVQTHGTARHVITLAFVRCLVYLFAEGWWPVIFGLIVYPIAHMNRITSIWFQNIAFLALNNLCYISFGAVVGSSMPTIQLGMICSTLYAQLSLVCAGFYRTLPPWLMWFRWVSYVFYTYSGILKGVHRYTDSYTCRAGDSRVGQKWCLLETSGVIEDMQLRGIDAAESSDAEASKDVSLSIGMLLVFYAINCLFLFGVLFYRLNAYPRTASHEINNNHEDCEEENESGHDNENEVLAGVRENRNDNKNDRDE